MSYGDQHRAVAQAFLARGFMTGDEAKTVVAAALTAADPARPLERGEVTDGLVMGVIGDVNDELARFDFEIRSMREQADRSRTVWAFVRAPPPPRAGR